MTRNRCRQLATVGLVVAFATLGQLPVATGQETPLQHQDTTAESGAAAAQAGEPATESKKTSYELRFTIISLSTRWSKVDPSNELLALHAERSLYYGPGIGARFYIKQPHHGLLVDFDYMVDTDVDSLNSQSKWKTDFAMAPHASFSAGGSIAAKAVSAAPSQTPFLAALRPSVVAWA